MSLIGRISQFPGVLLSDMLTDKNYLGEAKEKDLQKTLTKKLAEEAKDAKGKLHPEVEGEVNNLENLADIEAQQAKGHVGIICKPTDPRLKGKRIYADLEKGQNAFSWVLTRRVMKGFALTYGSRIQA